MCIRDRVEVDPLVGLDQAKAEEIVKAAGFSAELQEKVVPVLSLIHIYHDVEDNQIGRFGVGLLEGVAAVTGGDDLKTGEAQGSGE